jgi:hypothetical protein
MATIIKATKDLYHGDGTKSFTKGCEYEVRDVNNQYELLNMTTTNNQGQPHKISLWYKHFKLVR